MGEGEGELRWGRGKGSLGGGGEGGVGEGGGRGRIYRRLDILQGHSSSSSSGSNQLINMLQANIYSRISIIDEDSVKYS